MLKGSELENLERLPKLLEAVLDDIQQQVELNEFNALKAKLNKKHPSLCSSTEVGTIRIEYEQFPYDNRYFTVSVNINDVVMTVAYHAAVNANYEMFKWLKIKPHVWNKFLQRVATFNKYLDK